MAPRIPLLLLSTFAFSLSQYTPDWKHTERISSTKTFYQCLQENYLMLMNGQISFTELVSGILYLSLNIVMVTHSGQVRQVGAVDTGPHRDIIGELTTALRAKGLHAGVYFSLYEWYHPLYVGPQPELYVREVMTPQLMEIIYNYKPDILWTDGEEKPSSFWNSTYFLAWLYNESPVREKTVVNDRWGSDCRGKHGGFYTEEYSSQTVADHKWEENSGIDIHSYGYNRNTPSDKYYTASYLIDLLTKTVAYGGNLCLKVGINFDGKIPNIMAERLLQIGAWLDVNGEGIYNTTTWKVPDAQVLVNLSHMVVFNNTDIVNGQVTPGNNTSNIKYLGTFETDDECLKSCESDYWCNSFTWVQSADDASKHQCFGRTDLYWHPNSEEGHVSGHRDSITIRYTASKLQSKTVYAIITDWPTGSTLNLTSPIPSQSTAVSILGYEGSLKWSGTPDKAGMSIMWPILTVSELPSMYQWTIKLTNVS
ncbi:tissue alpha-L-fucosidase-like [Corticium candelabrum]|uniref:tissue alpha-L-fucosidase-like n=1 Tax=Corticium candelabrum TaxID=121492 RepID=UPI002E255CAD|nr:tissue alpha-L-fucosidase-like [Corticium candelabrum]